VTLAAAGHLARRARRARARSGIETDIVGVVLVHVTSIVEIWSAFAARTRWLPKSSVAARSIVQAGASGLCDGTVVVVPEASVTVAANSPVTAATQPMVRATGQYL